MQTEWSWKFRDARVGSVDGLSDVILSIGYSLFGQRGEKVFEIGGETPLPKPDPATFIPFAQLTEASTIALVSSAVDVAQLKKQIDAWHDESAKPLPFAS